MGLIVLLQYTSKLHDNLEKYPKFVILNNKLVVFLIYCDCSIEITSDLFRGGRGTKWN